MTGHQSSFLGAPVLGTSEALVNFYDFVTDVAPPPLTGPA